MVVPRLCCAAALFFILLLAADTAFAQDAPLSPPAPFPTWEKIADIAAKQEADLRKQIDDTRALVEAEIAAKRLDPAAAQNLLVLLRPAPGVANADFRPLLISHNNMTTPDRAVNDAIQKLEEVSAKLLVERNKLIQDATQLAKDRTALTVHTAEKPSDFDALITTVENTQRVLTTRLSNGMVYPNGTVYPGNTVYSPSSSFSNCLSLLRSLQGALVARDTGDAKLLGQAITRLRQPANMTNDDSIWSSIEAQMRINSLVKPYADAIQSAQTALDESLLAHSPSDKVAEALAKLEDASNKLQAVQGSAYSTSYNEGTPLLNIYRSLTALARAVENHDIIYVQGNMQTLRHNLSSLGAERANKLEKLFVQWQAQTDEKTGHVSTAQRSAWGERLAAVKNADDLEAIAREIQKAERDYRPGRDPELPQGLSTQLLSLAAAWSSGNLMSANGTNYAYENALSIGAYVKELTALRQRVQRDVMSRTLQAPELLKPPLSEQSLDTALNSLANDLVNAHEWRRVLTLLELRSPTRFTGAYTVTTPLNDSITAIRAYLAGQNYELAEQWADALTSYKVALATTAEFGPIKEAAERIKAISKEHPISIPMPATPAPVHGATKHRPG